MDVVFAPTRCNSRTGADGKQLRSGTILLNGGMEDSSFQTVEQLLDTFNRVAGAVQHVHDHMSHPPMQPQRRSPCAWPGPLAHCPWERCLGGQEGRMLPPGADG
ncbi:uncharacterized protein LOC142768428 [Rhipicephalus microplus]|uniref:uncharacterized protein LOC142768428 n=1 Tax=Rhipicephalus microplus TaxID=6941 RepID=UPI003F6C7673